VTAPPNEWDGFIPHVVALVRRERARAVLRGAFPRRKGRLVFARNADDVSAALRTSLVDAVIVDVAGPQEETWRAASLAMEHPTAAFFAMSPMRAGDAGAIADCAHRDFAGTIIEGIDDGVARDIVVRATFSARFAKALMDPPSVLALASPIQQQTWSLVVAHAGRPVRTSALASALEVTREHLSRSFAANGSPNLKRVIDLVRVIAAAELAKNPGLDLRDVSAVLGFASPSHLSTTSQRITGTKPVSLTRLRTVDIIDRFVRGHGRSRN
jgi:AraC-like DNA-binding protein